MTNNYALHVSINFGWVNKYDRKTHQHIKPNMEKKFPIIAQEVGAIQPFI